MISNGYCGCLPEEISKRPQSGLDSLILRAVNQNRAPRLKHGSRGVKAHGQLVLPTRKAKGGYVERTGRRPGVTTFSVQDPAVPDSHLEAC